MRSFQAMRNDQEILITYDHEIIFIKGPTFFQKLDINLNLQIKWIVERGYLIGFKHKKSKITSQTSNLLLFKKQLDGQVIYLSFEQFYCINSILGYGGCSEAVYKVTNYLDNKQYAAKKIPKGSDQDSTYKEITILKQLDHTNIVKLIEVFNQNGEIYIIMERLYHLKNIQKSEEWLQSITLQILKGLYYIHSQGLIHRDLKKSNIMMTLNGEIKIIDFGLCIQKNQVKHRCGTIGYMAPEVLKQEHYDERCDLFSLGCVIYEMFYDKYLFDGADTNEVKKRNQECIINFEASSDLSLILTDLLENLLCDQQQRLTSEQALEHEFFDQQVGISKYENLHTKASIF